MGLETIFSLKILIYCNFVYAQNKMDCRKIPARKQVVYRGSNKKSSLWQLCVVHAKLWLQKNK